MKDNSTFFLFITGAASALLACSSAYAAELVDLNLATPAALSGFVKQSQDNVKNTVATGNSLQLVNKHTTKNGSTHARYQQYYNGLPVFGYHVLEHTQTNKQVTLSGKLVQQLEKDIASTVKSNFTPKETLARLKKEYVEQHSALTNAAENSAWVFKNEHAETVIYLDKDHKAKQAYYINFFTVDPNSNTPTRPHYLIDVTTNDVLRTWEGLTTSDAKSLHNKAVPFQVTQYGRGPGGNPKVGLREYGDKNDYLEFSYVTYDWAGIQGHLFNEHVKVYDWKNDTRMDIASHPSWWIEGDSFYFEGNAKNGGASPENDALYFGTMVKKELLRNAGPDALRLKKLLMNVHYAQNYVNAFWDGSSVTFGDGDHAYYPLTTMEIVAHEIGHGVTENNSNLIYSEQSGGLNESFSDVMGKYFEAFLNNQLYKPTTVNWTMGDSIAKEADTPPFRYMNTPAKDGNSIEHLREYDDYLDPHYSSGLFNKVYYVMATTDSWGLHAPYTVFLHANQHYWYPDITFVDAAWGLVQAAEDMYGNNGMAITIKALSQVGIQCDISSCRG